MDVNKISLTFYLYHCLLLDAFYDLRLLPYMFMTLSPWVQKIRTILFFQYYAEFIHSASRSLSIPPLALCILSDDVVGLVNFYYTSRSLKHERNFTLRSMMSKRKSRTSSVV
jgi:hypothetical protein